MPSGGIIREVRPLASLASGIASDNEAQGSASGNPELGPERSPYAAKLMTAACAAAWHLLAQDVLGLSGLRRDQRPPAQRGTETPKRGSSDDHHKDPRALSVPGRKIRGEQRVQRRVDQKDQAHGREQAEAQHHYHQSGPDREQE